MFTLWFLFWALPWYLNFGWFFFLAVTLIFLASDSDDRMWGAAILTCIGAPTLLYLGDGLTQVVHAIFDNPLRSGVYALAYLGIGILYSMFRYFMKVKDAVSDIKSYNKDGSFTKKYNALITHLKNPTTGDHYDGINVNSTFTDYLYWKGNIPTFNKNKSQISAWAVWWIISLPIYFLSDYIYRLIRNLMTPFKFIYDGLASIATKSLEG